MAKGMRDPFDDVKDDEIRRDEDIIVKVLGAKDTSATATKQLPADMFEKEMAGQIIPPLYDPMVWAFLLEQNTRLKKLIDAMANNTVGLGWMIVPKREEESYQEQHREEISKEREKFVALFEEINPKDPFTEVMKKVKVDEEATGYAFLEVIRTKNGKAVSQLWHIPSHTMRQAKSSMGRVRYVQMRLSEPGRKVWFKDFGEVHSLDAATGKWDDEDGVTVTDPANEVLKFALYSPRSSYYGVPRVVSAAPAIAGTRLAQRRNVAFFENDATPRIAIIVNGGELSEESMRMIEEFVDVRAKGPGNAGRLMLLQPKGTDELTGDAKQVSIEVIPLTVGVQDDASFTKYIGQNNEEVREAFGIGQIFIGTSDDVNRAVALAMKQLTTEQVFEPESARYEYKINKAVMDTNGAKVTRLRFQRPRTTDIVAESQALSVLASQGGVTPNDIRDFQRKPRFAAKWADTPIPVLRAGLLELRDDKEGMATLWDTYGDTLPQFAPPPAKTTVAKFSPDELDLEAFDVLYGSAGSDIAGQVQTIAQDLRKLGFEVTIRPPAVLNSGDRT